MHAMSVLKKVQVEAYGTVKVEFSWASDTHENLYTQTISISNYGGLLSPTKINPIENLTHEILWARKLLYLGQLKLIINLSSPSVPDFYFANLGNSPLTIPQGHV